VFPHSIVDPLPWSTHAPPPNRTIYIRLDLMSLVIQSGRMSRVEIRPMLQDNMSERRNIFTQNLKELVAIVLSYISNMLLICIVNVRLNHSRLKYNNLFQVWHLTCYSWSNISIHFSSHAKLIQDSDITC
jgi:hypothetical protein